MKEAFEELSDPGFLSTELASSLTHGVGLAISIAGLVLLVVFSSLRGGALSIVACSIYGATLVLLYLASTLYHSSRRPRVREVMQVVDHSAIYLLIAGTYTPFALISLRGAWGWSLFGVVWALALCGIGFKLFFTGRFQLLSTLIYLAMGWLAVIIIKPLMARLPAGAVWWLLAGGLAYTGGVVFYVCRRIPYNHAIWHLFVMAGSTCHFFAVMLYVI